ncbi:MAG TPA: hypothetical protein VKH18_06980 [Terriglobales bacterium]|nr:hypothetical protein [Terriglobales bacterium]
MKRRQMRHWAGILALGGVMGAGLVLAQARTQGAAQTSGQTTQSSTQSSTQTTAPSSTPAQTAAPASATYQPKFAGDPARSESEAQALGYMRVVLRAQREYKKRHDKYADSLAALAGTASFTKRMSQTTDRGDYTASFSPHKDKGKDDKDGFVLTMTPNHMDSEHRSFYAEDDGAIHADDQKAADLDSPKVK